MDSITTKSRSFIIGVGGVVSSESDFCFSSSFFSSPAWYRPRRSWTTLSLLFAVLSALLTSTESMTTTTTTTSSESLLPVLRRYDPSIERYEVDGKFTQANAEGSVLTVFRRPSDDDEETSEALFVKRVDAAWYARTKSWVNLRRTLTYARTEVRFYREFVPTLFGSDDDGPAFAPACRFAECDLVGLMDEDEGANEVDRPRPWSDDEARDALVARRGGALVLEAVSSSRYLQRSPLSLDEAETCLRAVARLHAAAWGRPSLLRKAAARLSDTGGSYHLRARDPSELANLVASWDAFRESFRATTGGVLDRPEYAVFGRRLFDVAEEVSRRLTPSTDDPRATVVHGDYKAMNVFLPRATNADDATPLVVDFASAGVGLGASDVAFHLVHAVRPELLDANGGGARLVETWRAALGRDDYPPETAFAHYQLACVDYTRFVLGRFWRSATPESFAKKRDEPNVVLVNRDVDAAVALVKRVTGFLDDLEAAGEITKTSTATSTT